MSWEDSFRSWASPPGETEKAKCDNSVRAIRKAVDASSSLSNRSIKVFAQGSYCNRTNVRQDSDVDVCLLCSDTFVFDLPPNTVRGDFGLNSPATYHYPEYKDDVGAALTSYFGKAGVTRGNKAFDIHENTYRIDADAVPTFEYRRYATDGSFCKGVTFYPDKGDRIINWPEQNYENGVTKNQATAQRFKAVVRILKRLRIKMAEEKVQAAIPIPSFLVECLVWNVPNDYFGHDTYKSEVRAALAYLFNNTLAEKDCTEWGEINELKYLFRGNKPWTLQQAHAFLSDAWDYLGFE